MQNRPKNQSYYLLITFMMQYQSHYNSFCFKYNYSSDNMLLTFLLTYVAISPIN